MSGLQRSPWFDQDAPECEPVRVLAEGDWSPSYELDAGAIFECSDGRYLLVSVSGCSCWPDRGITSQVVCASLADVDREARSLFGGHAAELLDQMQSARKEERDERVE